jgi:hypothetical protein
MSAADTQPNCLRRQVLQALATAVPLLTVGGCGGSSSGAATAVARTWRMGFFPTSPSAQASVLLHGIDLMSSRADLIHIHDELPWTQMLSGTPPAAVVQQNYSELVAYLRGKGLRLGFMADLTDGLDRSQDPPQLVALGRSVREPELQQLYRDYVVAFATQMQPDYVGLTAETNLVRSAAPADLYAAVVTAANAGAADLLAAAVSVPLMISVQVEVAWGFSGAAASYVGIDTDFADFPFIQRLGLSSYPYFQFNAPENLPSTYYSRLLAGRGVSAMVAEGGWSSASFGAVISTPDAQARFLTRQADLLDSIQATAVIQTLFADLDLASLPQALADQLAPFANLGIADSAFTGKPAQAVWDRSFARPLAQGA